MTIQTDIRLRERESGINGNTHELVYLYYPICEVVALLHCGRQKAVNALRELQYAGLVEIQKQGCGKEWNGERSSMAQHAILRGDVSVLRQRGFAFCKRPHLQMSALPQNKHKKDDSLETID